MKVTPVDRDAWEYLQRQIDELREAHNISRNNHRPTIPDYDSSNFPIDGVGGQIAVAPSLGLPDTNAKTLWFFDQDDGQWHESKGLAVASDTFTGGVLAPGGLVAWWRMGEAVNFSQTYITGRDMGDGPTYHEFANALVDTSGYAGGPRNMYYNEAVGTILRPSTQQPNTKLGDEDDGAIMWNGGATAFYVPTSILPASLMNFGSGLKTVSFWFKTPPSIDGGPLIGNTDVDTSPSPAVVVGWNVQHGQGYFSSLVGTAKTIGFYLQGGLVLESTGVLAVDTWYHIAITYNGTTYRLYINGSLADAGNAGTSTYSSNPFRLGHYRYKSGFQFLGSWAQAGVVLDEVALYNITLTQAQIQAIARGSSTNLNVVNVSTTYSIGSEDQVILANGTFTVTLPSAVGLSGHSVTIKNIGTGTITVGRTGSETIDGSATNLTLATSKMARELTSDGTGWHITAAYL